MKNNAFAENLFRLRVSHNFTQTEIAKKLDITRPNYINLEKGESNPKDSTVQRVAKLYGLKPESLFSEKKKYSSLRFRLKSLKTSRQKNQRDSTIQIFSNELDAYIELENILVKNIQFNYADKKFSSPKQAALKVRSDFGLDEYEPILDICDLLQKVGIRLILLSSPLKEFFGLSVKLSENNLAIGINRDDSISIERKIFTIAHELGHILLHSDSFQPEEQIEKEKEEREADEFASYFLLPEKGFWNEWNKRQGLSFVQKVLQIKRIYKVSYKTILLRLDSYYKKSKAFNPYMIFNKSYKKGISSKEEPEGLTEYDFAEENFPAMVREAFLKEEVSFARACELLKISTSEMRELANSWYAEEKAQ